MRGDDAAGFEVARRVRSVEVLRCLNGAYELMDLWEGADEVMVVDAARSGAPAGTIHRIDAGRQTLPRGLLGKGTHSMGVAETVELARRLGRLPGRLTVYGIEIAEVATGTGLSPRVEQAVEDLVREIDGA